MNHDDILRLMHAVLDGEASEAERASLDRALAADAKAKADFDALQGLFATLDKMPRHSPPAGFADRVVALQRSMGAGDPARQLFSQSGVIGPSGEDIRVRAPARNATEPRTTSDSTWGKRQMAMSKRSMWIVGGVAAAIAAMFIGGVVEFPPSGEKAAGTIVPAKRHQGVQPGAADVKLDTGTPAPTTANVPTSGNTAASNTAASNTAASNTAASNTAASNTAASNTAASNTAASNTAASNTAASNTAASNTAASNTAASNTAASNTAASNTAASNTAASNTAASNTAASNTAASNTAASNTAASNTAASNTAASNKAASNTAASNTAASNTAASNKAASNTAASNTAASNTAASNNKK